MTTRQYELVERVLSYQPNADEALLNRAYVYAMKAHGNQKRASGAPYFSHPLEVAAILAEMRLDDATVATALLHDTIEDTETTRSEIDAMFGREIAEKTIPADDMREGLIHSIQRNVEVDEPEPGAAPTLPQERRPILGRDDQSTDTQVDVITEEQLLRGMESLTPTEPSANGGGTSGGG